jgi:hypothetical protein
MNPTDPKIGNALKEIEAVYADTDALHAYYDQKNRVYVLIVSGEEAETYRDAVKAIHHLATNAQQVAGKKRR